MDFEIFGAFWGFLESSPVSTNAKVWALYLSDRKSQTWNLVKCNHSTEIKYAGKYEMRIKEDI